jgi:hypothetical protein
MNKSKSGVQKRQEKLAKELQNAAAEPKQREICFAPLSVHSESPEKFQS